MTEYQIQANSRRCVLTGRELLPGEKFYSVLLDEAGYTTNVFDKHLHLHIKKEYFAIWLEHFEKTVNDLFAGEKAEMAKQRAQTIAYTFENKLEQMGKLN